MKFLLVALNAKYIHSNLGVYSLKAYVDSRSLNRGAEIEIAEYTINNHIDDVLKDIYRRRPQAVGFSCYIWNISYVMELVRDIPKILPGVDIWLGGPEASYRAKEILAAEAAVCGIMMGEGEETFAQVMGCYEQTGQDMLFAVEGVAYRKPDGSVQVNPLRHAIDLSSVPFPYKDISGFDHKIIYYESSRGCPFSCSYCLSSLDKSVRFRDIDMVKKELDFFLDKQVCQVKFVDRTFNCKKNHAFEIWKHISDHDNGITNFHFEISADLLDEDELNLLGGLRPGLIQLEIGVQTTNPGTLKEIRRNTDLVRLKKVVARINENHNIHQHLDLIAGLPYEDYGSFAQSFNDVFEMHPQQLQLGFLKVLNGSFMAEMADQYGLRYKSLPPYEVLSGKWLSYGEILRLKAVEDMVEVYYNSGQFRYTLSVLLEQFATPFSMFEALADYYERHGLFLINHNRLARYEILHRFVQELMAGRVDEKEIVWNFRDLLVYDLYLRENLKSRPSFARNQEAYKGKIKEFYLEEHKKPMFLCGYEGYDSRQISKMTHLEVFGGGRAVLFDYKERDPLTYDAKTYEIYLRP